MLTVNIKPQNVALIESFISKTCDTIQGIKLIALYTLIQKRGEIIESNEESINGLKCLEFKPGEYIAIKRAGGKVNFYPCMTKIFHLKH